MSKVKRLLISPDFFTNLSTGKVEIISSDIPSTAEIVGIGINESENYFYILLSDESFEELKSGDLISDLPPTVFKRIEN